MPKSINRGVQAFTSLPDLNPQNSFLVTRVCANVDSARYKFGFGTSMRCEARGETIFGE